MNDILQDRVGMAFDYDKIKADEDSGGHWATYSDLFAALSMVFLLLYVVSSLRTGTMGIQQHIEYEQIKRQNADLQEQIRVYNTLKDDYLKTGSSEEELQTYENLMNQLVLLKDQAKDEKERLRRESEENAQKEEALNEYQQLVRNIINSNLISQARVQQRQRIIHKKDDIIGEKQAQVASLESTVQQKEAELKAGQAEIQRMSADLDAKVNQLQEAYRKQEITKSSMENQIAKLREENEKRINELRESNSNLTAELETMNVELNQASNELKRAQTTIEVQESTISKLVDEQNEISQQMAQLKKNHAAQMKREKEAFEKQMAQQQLSAKQRAEKEAEFRRQAQQKEQQLAQQIGQLEGKVQQGQAELDQAMAARLEAEKAAQNLAKEAAELGKDLQKMKEVAQARERLVKEIKDSLAKAGVEAEVDGKTGDVILSFGEEYFDTGQAQLKPGMREILKKFMPIYSEKLLADPKVAEKVRSVEIIGFASPTYKGKFVDPVSLQAQDRDAVNYNLDLSYYRARSIFDHIFDTNKMQYKFQQDLLPRVKVTGRSFLAEGHDRELASQLSVKEYCEKYNCKQSQRVIIRFDLQP